MTVPSKCWKEWTGCKATASSERQMGASQYREETRTRGTGTDSVGYTRIIQSHDSNEACEDTTVVRIESVDTVVPKRCLGATSLTILCYCQALTDTTHLQFIEIRRNSTHVESGFCRAVLMTKFVVGIETM